MKTVTGKLVSTKPISLSNASKYISRFTSSDNGASHAVSVYLQRASDSFNSLVQFQKKLKGSQSRREEQVSQPLDLDTNVGALGTADENPPREKIKNSESKGKGKKNQEFELNKDVPLEIKHDKVVVNEVEMRKSSEIKGKDEKNQIFEVKNEETLQIEHNPDGVVEKKKRKKSGKENVQKGGAVMIEQAADVAFEIDGDKNFGSKEKGTKNHKFDAKNEQTLQIERTTEGVVEKKEKKKSGKENEETLHVQRRLDREDTDEKVLDEGGEKSKLEIVEVEGGSEKWEKKKKRKKGEDAEVEERSKGEDGKKAEDRKVDGGETIDLSEQSGKKNVTKSEGFDKSKQDIMEDEGDMNGAGGISVKRWDKMKKKKKRKENECKQEEEGIGGEGVQKQNSRDVDAGESVDLADKNGKKKGSNADWNDKIKQRNVEVKGEIYRVEEGSVEMRGKKNKKTQSKGEEAEKSFEGEEAEKSFEGEEEKNMKSGEVDSGESVNLAEQIRKSRGSETDGNDKIKQDNVEIEGEMDRVEGALEMKDKTKKIKKTDGEEVEKSFGGEEGKKRKGREVDGGETIDLTEQTGKKKKRRKIEGEGK